MTALLSRLNGGQTVQEAAMKRALTVIVLLVLAAGSSFGMPEQASAGSSTDAALALGAFAHGVCAGGWSSLNSETRRLIHQSVDELHVDSSES